MNVYQAINTLINHSNHCTIAGLFILQLIPGKLLCSYVPVGVYHKLNSSHEIRTDGQTGQNDAK